MKITDYISRLREECPTLQNRVYGSIELADTMPTSMRPPCAFIIGMAEKANPNKLIGGYSQLITAQIGVVICVKNYRDERGDIDQSLLEDVRREIRLALCNWQAPDTEIPTEFYQGQLAAYDNSLIRWNDVFTTQFFYRK